MKLIIAGYFLFYITFSGGIIVINNTIAWLIVENLAISKTHGRVSIRIKRFIGLHFHKPVNEQSVSSIELIIFLCCQITQFAIFIEYLSCRLKNPIFFQRF